MPKCQSNSGTKYIGTHNGTFHCDEVMACWMLKQLPQFKEAKIVRTRNVVKLKWCHAVVDIGGVYEPKRLRFDHHQTGFEESMNSLANYKWNTKLSSAGLVYLHFGKDVISVLTNLSKDSNLVQTLYEKVYEMLIEEIDAYDNDIAQYDGVPKYHITTTLVSRVQDLNPAWNAVNPDVEEAFAKALNLCGSEFVDKVNYFKDVWIPGHNIVEEAVKHRFIVHSSGHIIVFLHCRSLLEEHLFDIEAEHNICGKIKFIIFQGKNSEWWVQCVPESLGSIQNRLVLHKDWCGLRDQTLCKVSGIPDCIFVHPSGFIGCNKTFKGALEMAKLSSSGE